MKYIQHFLGAEKNHEKFIFLYFLLFFGDLLFMRRWYSSCACLMPLSPVTVLTVTKGSSNRSLRRAMISSSPCYPA